MRAVSGMSPGIFVYMGPLFYLGRGIKPTSGLVER
jgi:hypothetical protein